ncbi:Hypothetical predicted protein [Mytilus galloprovincialis]|uniref:PLA2c domain-containing protein n=1 Tax=Mytilus galloprovincialis TaxID=29158 RepID=A0A8B6DJB8_MYTGA|nr:Hypothetical predicted protein [Mytilus galloprovincialis]
MNNDVTDEIDFNNDYMMLVDAGLSFNSPYPLVLHGERKVDIIISFDWSDRGEDTYWPFEELEKAEQWAKERRVPFPDLTTRLQEIKEDWEKGIYEEVYIFRGQSAPTIVHFVMINKSFRRVEDASSDFDILPEYKTLRFGYSEKEFLKFSKLVRHNVIQNRNFFILFSGEG